MKYVGLAALAATFWLLVATVRVMVQGDCRCARQAAETNVAAPEPAPLVPPPVNRTLSSDTDCGLPGLGDGGRAPTPVIHPMSKMAVVSGMHAVKPLVHACYLQYQVPGMAMVNVVIAKGGEVYSATTTGKFAGTPTGECVERAVKTARFPPSDGLSTPYPFVLR